MLDELLVLSVRNWCLEGLCDLEHREVMMANRLPGSAHGLHRALEVAVQRMRLEDLERMLGEVTDLDFLNFVLGRHPSASAPS